MRARGSGLGPRARTRVGWPVAGRVSRGADRRSRFAVAGAGAGAGRGPHPVIRTAVARTRWPGPDGPDPVIRAGGVPRPCAAPRPDRHPARARSRGRGAGPVS
ncbi:hypothetical protein SSP531S_48540 [Streptomyces spongiicola]|uniref:Uncharacterized protein n=1 Tax=Streptomyces spongiicola TaxID=1690221 RepID=A0A388T5D1_9ACTN|nr:hypothetical protein SSP531S_48540 [Streptomyces spongiicola]